MERCKNLPRRVLRHPASQFRIRDYAYAGETVIAAQIPDTSGSCLVFARQLWCTINGEDVTRHRLWERAAQGASFGWFRWTRLGWLHRSTCFVQGGVSKSMYSGITSRTYSASTAIGDGPSLTAMGGPISCGYCHQFLINPHSSSCMYVNDTGLTLTLPRDAWRVFDCSCRAQSTTE